ncbi:hypothetical protein [Ruegeria sp. HKCCD7318]|uniref:hypothetical protein n=1 Tax=Ruegeria sp. HKCCD7318 TaxID=2683014 RepID=UPI001491244C|nr:hypothetical protein [Ruegeria sp. HKCCD7318]NOE32313.1 hypothetical protein [Ruegeria sp. HKCCD7318]
MKDLIKIFGLWLLACATAPLSLPMSLFLPFSNKLNEDEIGTAIAKLAACIIPAFVLGQLVWDSGYGDGKRALMTFCGVYFAIYFVVFFLFGKQEEEEDEDIL